MLVLLKNAYSRTPLLFFFFLIKTASITYIDQYLFATSKDCRAGQYCNRKGIQAVTVSLCRPIN